MALEPPPPPPPPGGYPPPPPAPPPRERSAPRLHRERARWFIAAAGITIVAVVVGVVVLTRSGGAPMTSGSTPGGQPTQEQLLAAAHASGKIDTPTWILYRAYSLFGASALPAEFQSGEQGVDDGSLAAELVRTDLPSGTHTQLAALMSRPTDSRSVYYGSGIVPAAEHQSERAFLAAATSCGAGSSPTGWVSRGNSTTSAPAFRVWTRCGGNWEQRLQSTIDDMNALWGPMTKLMGDPLPDADPAATDPSAYGGDGAVDIYLVPAHVSSPRLGGQSSLTLAGLEASGLAVPAAPFVGNTSSAYILADERTADTLDMRSLLAHEFFHVLEDAHNQKALNDFKGDHYEANWYTEASAVWASTHFAPGSSNSGATYWSNVFLADDDQVSLLAQGPAGTDNFGHIYASWVWLLFMEQEAGADAIGAAWTGSTMETATNGAQGTAAFDEAFGFGTHFADFAVRNLNVPALKRAEGHLYSEAFPNFTTAALRVRYTLPLTQQGASETPAVSAGIGALPRLSAAYYRFTTDSGVKQVKWNITSTPADAHVHVDVILQTPTVKRVTLPTGASSLCDLNGPTTGFLVISNADRSTAPGIGFAAQGVADSCTQAPTPDTITCTGMSPPQVTANDTNQVVTFTGSGFSLLDPSSIVVGGGQVVNHSILTVGFQPEGGLERNQVVSDTQVDVTLNVSSTNDLGPYNIDIGGVTTGTQHNLSARCAGTLAIVSGQ